MLEENVDVASDCDSIVEGSRVMMRNDCCFVFIQNFRVAGGVEYSCNNRTFKRGNKLANLRRSLKFLNFWGNELSHCLTVYGNFF